MFCLTHLYSYITILNRKTRSKHLSSLSLCASGLELWWGVRFRPVPAESECPLTLRAEDWFSTGPRDYCWSAISCVCGGCQADGWVGGRGSEVNIYSLDFPLGSVCSDCIGYGRTCVFPLSTKYYSVLTGVFRRWKACDCESFVSRFNMNLFSKVCSDKVIKSDEWS